MIQYGVGCVNVTLTVCGSIASTRFTLRNTPTWGRRGRGIGGVLPVEDDVVGGERFAVVPDHVALETPGDGRPVLRHAAVLEARHFARERRGHGALEIE